MLEEVVGVESLDAIQRDTLAVLAVAETSSSSLVAWQDLVRRARLLDARGRALTGDEFTAVLERLVTAGAVKLSARHEYVISPAWIAPVLVDAAKRSRLYPLWDGSTSHGGHSYVSPHFAAAGEVRVALASGAEDRIANANLKLKNLLLYADHRGPVLLEILGSQPPTTWIEALDPPLQEAYLQDLCDFAFQKMGLLGHDAIAALVHSDVPALRAQAAILFALAGEPDRAREIVADGASPWERGAFAFVALTEGDQHAARNAFAAAAIGKRGQHLELPGCLAIFDLLLAATSDRADDLHQLPARIVKCKRQLSIYFGARFAIEALASFRVTTRTRSFAPDTASWVDALVVGLVQQWTHQRFSVGADLLRHAASAKENGYLWVAAELERVTKGSKKSSLLSLLGQKETWELALDAMTSATAAAPETTSASRAPAADAELWWELTLHERSILVDPYLSTRRAARGKKLSLARLHTENVPLGDRDRRILQLLENPRARMYSSPPLSTLLAFVDHPRVRNAAGITLTIRRGEPTLRVEETPLGAKMSSFPSTFDEEGIAVTDDHAGKIVVFVRSPQAARILAVVPAGGLAIPKEGLSRMSEVLGALGGTLAVEASAGLTSETVTADPRIHIQLFRAGSGLRVRLRVVPGGTTGPALRPGVLPAETVVNVDGSLRRVIRDLDDERARLERLLEACPTLASLPQDGDDRIAHELAMCLELLIELEAGAVDAVIAWPAGQPLRAPTLRQASDVRIRVKGSTSWLTIEGEVQVDEGRVVDMRELLAAASRGTGRFVPIGPDEWIALTEELRLKLEGLERLASLSAGGRVSAALLPAVDGLVEGLEATFTKELENLRTKLQDAHDVTIAVPADLKAELRDYQREGFEFLARRTAGGLGACLADDMGLGKTVQALALLIHRKDEGPSLVVAPTSVCRNWEAEAARFAPSLTLRRFGDEDRKATVEGAGPGDVVVMSYALLVAEEALVASRTWGTIVYDEAHALKNASTRRWAAAHALSSNASIALTGTPVENRVGEIHAVLDLLVPGMLGSRQAFERVFGGPMSEGDRQSAAQLRQLVRPFVLRRSKAQVLSELPPKTEIVRVVTPTPEHRAFYEAVRRRALDQMTAARVADRSTAGRARMQLLAEIMRLRRSAIDPRLVGGADAPHGTKIDALVELVLELRDEGRRALIFSQFLEVLDLARSALEEKGITCQRLDGTMSADARGLEVDAFQRGKGDVFLLSLKAGGVGMNLTAADFVILLDPWWNPAVEDQAADRAHRIGQSRAVTVVRLVTEGTIEEKVLTLHAKKRKLYEDVVADADGGGTIDVDAMAALLEESTPIGRPASA